MQRLGFVLFLAGVVIAAWFAARPVDLASLRGPGDERAVTAADRIGAWGGIAGWPFGIGVLLMVGGGVLARRAQRQDSRASAGDTADGTDALRQLHAIGEAVVALPDGDPHANEEILHEQLDRILEEMVPAFLEEREAVIASLGLMRYAELTSEFASAERSLARAWSALTDEAWFEVTPCLAAARDSMANAVRLAAHPANSMP